MHATGTNGQCTAEVTATRTGAGCTVKTMVMCNGGLSTGTISSQATLCDLFRIPDGNACICMAMYTEKY